ncbi:MAG: Gldg family protein [Geminicoccaceae bacterium]|nr:Gldg family protein [Geminicoccaceae bacterium]MCX8102595.1 Gldg family protein [Geminicoccaceae bacterium]MDW8369634.1 Gldg family protein [Geminicoccaceae bacterium]
MRDRSKLAAIGIALAAIFLVATTAWATLTLRGVKLDLTQNRQYTLSKPTLDLLAGMKEPITLRLYVSKGVREANPLLASYADRVRDLLKAYVVASNGKITLEQLDPEPFSSEEDRAVGFGLQPIALEGGTNGYLGLAGTNGTDDVDVIPVLSPERERFLEYDLTRLVYNLAYPDKPVVALIAGLPINGDPLNQYKPWQVFEQLRQFFTIRYMAGDIEKFDDDIQLLMLVHPNRLSDKTLFAIDQFVLRGGKVLAFLDPHSEAAAMRSRVPAPEAQVSSLGKLLEAWGVEIVPDRFVADRRAARQVQYPQGGRTQIVDYLAWLAYDKAAFNRAEPLVADLNRLTFMTVGAIRKREGAQIELVPLVSSSPDSQLVDVAKVASFPDPLGLVRGFAPEGERRVLAARLSGTVRSAWPEALPEGVGEPAERLTQSKGPVSIVLVADSDLLEDRAWLASQMLLGQQVTIPLADNADFVANALDYLAGSAALSGLRGREVTLRPFTRVEELRRNAEIAYRAKEQELLERLKSLQDKLASLEVKRGEDGGALVTPEQRAEIDGLRAQLLDTRRELRDVQYELRRDIESLRDRLRLLGIVAVPVLVAAIGIVVALVRRARWRQRFAAA